MRELTCTFCGAELANGIDTFGPVGMEVCQWCWWGELHDEADDETWYGLGPHHHDLTITGHIIGSTVHDPLPEPNENGEYEIEPGLFFRPDDEAPGCGIWREVGARKAYNADAQVQALRQWAKDNGQWETRSLFDEDTP